MRDSNENSRDYADENKINRSLDEPAVRRRGPASHALSRREKEERDYEKRASRLSESSFSDCDEEGDSFEEQLRRRAASRSRDRNEYDEYDDEEDFDRVRAPLLVRFFSWIALLVIFFACGYMGANYFFNWADKRTSGQRIGNIVGSGTEVVQMTKKSASTVKNIKSATYTLYIPENGKFASRETDIKKGLKEEDAVQIISMYIDVLKENNIFLNDVRLLNVYTSGDWAYLDMTAAFQESLKKLGKKEAAFALTGMLKTVSDNFPPVKKIKFFIDGKEAKDKSPINLTLPWETLK